MSENENILNKKIDNENEALNVMVSLMGVAQSRGAFSIPESAKLWECIKVFQHKKIDEKEEEFQVGMKL